MDSLKSRLTDLSPEKRELLEALLRKKKAAAAAAASIPPRGDLPGPFPLSFAQERLWLVDQLDPGSLAYNIPVALRFTGALDVAALRKGLATIVRRHEALRTRFEVKEGEPVQVIDPPDGFALPVVDLSGLPPEEREEEARRRAQAEALRPFDLRRGPVFRAVLFRLARDRHVMAAVMHHIVSDGWSLGVFTHELSLLYGSFSAGRRVSLPSPPIQYPDFALWQRRMLSGPALERQLDMWRQRLAGLDPVLDLPADRPRPARPSGRGAIRSFALPEPLSRDLRELAERQGTTLFTVLLASLFALLQRQTGREDLCVGTPVAGRRQVETEGLIGFFVNTLAIRADLAGDPPFAEHLARVHCAVLDAHANQDVPFDRVVQEVAPERSPSYTPIFQVLFSLQNAFGGSLELPGLTIDSLEIAMSATKFDLSLGMAEQAGRLVGGLEHSLDLFDRPTVDRTLEQLGTLLERVAAAPASRLSDLPLLTPAERHQILAEWGAVEGEPLAGATLHGLFAAQAARTPEAVALVHGTLEQTYAELAVRAGGLARYLRRLGVAPETRVAVCLERSPDLIATLLGVLAAGGAYVPIDPAYPASRQALMLEDSGAAVLVTRGGLRARGGPFSGVTVEVDHWIDRTDLSDLSGLADFPALALPGHLAYLIYTSGSTGRPKGVAIEHRSAVALAGWARERFSDEELSGVLVGTSICFDLSVFEIFAPLAWGGRLILAENALELPALPAASEVRLLNTVPSVAAELVRSGDLPASVRTVNLAGEPLPADLAARLYATGTVERVLDLYGPSEDTTYSTGSLVPRTIERAPAIGRPLPGTRAYVVDRERRPVPALVAGELWLAGTGLARGYLGRPELTAERFVPDPFGGLSGRGGERAYRTGDLARFRPDGELEFLGRIDHQVKVRGFRIELGEIEEVLRGHPAVGECVVVVREGALAAYVVPDQTDRTDRSDLKTALAAWLRDRLPAYMVPAAWVVLEALPRTPNGKVDRKALPAPERRSGAAEPGHVAPGDPVEERLAGFWQEVLGVDRVGVHDNFFALGGHSLLATQVISRMREAFGVDLHPRALFESPTVAALARAVREAEMAIPAPPLVPVERDGDLPLSFAQQRLWFLDQLEPGSAAYNIPLAVRLTGELRMDLLERVFAEVPRRQEALRTTFASRGEEPFQVIADELRPVLPVVDLSSLPEAEREAWALRIAEEEARRPFDLRSGPLLRVGLVRLGAREHLLLVTLHHIISDGWSQGVLLREIAALHEAFSQGSPSPLPDLPLQYADFAVWQRRWLTGPMLAAQLDFWRRELAGVPALLELPADRPRPAVPSYRGASFSFPLPAAAVHALARRADATPFMVLLAAFQTLLYHHTAANDLLVGSPIANRNRVEVEGLIGLFVNTLVFRLRLGAEDSFLAVLERVRAATLTNHEHQDLPFELLVDALGVERSLSYNPVFQVMLTLLNAPAGELRVPGLVLAPIEAPSTTAKLDLTLALSERSRDFAAAFEYALDLFDASTVARLAAHLRTLLEAAATDPGLEVGRLPLLSPAERHQLLRAWNDTAAVLPEPRSFVGLFAAQVARRPEAPAVTAGPPESPVTLTYAELDRRADRLGHWLRARGAGPETLVVLLETRGIDLLTAILAVFKTGAAYLPLDPAHPAARQRERLRQSGVRLVVAGEPHLPLLEGAPDVEAVVAAAAQHNGELPALAPLPDSLAYVIFTSGSTGVPKGAMVSQRGMVNHLWAKIRDLGLGPDDVVAQTASQCFDISVWQHLAALSVGGRVRIYPDAVAHDPPVLLAWVAAERVTVLQAVPSLLREMLDDLDQRGAAPDLAALRWMIPTGEALAPDIWARWLQRYPAVPLVNAYGPTECSDDVSHAVLAAPPPGAGPLRVPLGRPVVNTRIYVVDRDLQAVPMGVAGELSVGGAGVGRGYLGDPERTAAVFVPDPLSGEPGSRLYRTGDLTRLRGDGVLEYLGRIDHQVKVRGYRIELGEIEAALGRHPAVREAVVLAREGALAAYVVLDRTDRTDLKTALAGWLRERLPEHMVPSAYVVLDSLPLTPNGKVDRKALPAPERRIGEPVWVDPAGPIETVLAGIWGEVLGLDRVGAHESFFALGGHSLLATRVMSRVRGAFGLELPVRQLFETPTIAGLARVVRQAERAMPQPPLLRVARSGDLPLSFAQQRLWFLDQLEPGSAAYNIPLAVRLGGELRMDLLERVFAEVVRRHEALRTTFASRDGQPVQVIAPPARPVLPVVDLSHLPPGERDERARCAALEEAGRPFDLHRGPLFRVSLVRLDPRDHVLLVTFHHIISDGWSLGVLQGEIATLYEAFAQGRPSPLPELPLQYTDFAAWQRRWLDGEVLDEQLAHWKRRLAGAPRVLELPADHPRPPVQTYRGAAVVAAFPPALSAAVRELCRKWGATPFMPLLAAWSVLLGRHAGQEDVLVGTPIAGRNRRETEGLIGLFVNTLVLRVELGRAPSFGEVLDRVREAALDAYAHQDLPFDRLVEELVPERDLSRSPLFQAMLVLQNAPRQEVRLPGLTLAPVDVEGRVAKVDLHLVLWEGADGFAGILEHSTDLFDRTTAERLLARFEALLEAAAADPGQAIADLPLLVGGERQQVLAEWNDAATSWPDGGGRLHELIAAQAARTPEAVAAAFEGEELTYRELEERANGLAHHLIHLGVEPDGRVGVLLERSLEMIVGLLGILKAGAAYVPLDPALPAERLAFVVESAGISVVIAQERLKDRLPSGLSVVLPPLPEGCERVGEGDRRGEGLAYVLYTSGSTGTPKGVMIPHRGIVNRLLWMQEAYRLMPEDRVLQKTPFGFDVSVWEFFWPLLAGARLVFARPEGHKDPAYLADLIVREKITTLHFVPSMLQAFLEVPGLEALSSLRLVMASGEALPPDLVRRFFARLGHAELHNLYGPTEASVDVSFWPCVPEPPRAVVPIGRPIANLRLHVVDRELRPQPIGVPGELLLGGVGLARGYLGRPDLTAAAFVPDPFADEPGSRLYRTGDLTRLLSDGNVEYLGRIDHQVKIRGFRIELGEIDAVLASHPAVRECVAVAREGALVAYVVGESLDLEKLRAFLGTRLPDYMVPSAFVVLESLPLTSNGKVDRKALPAPERRVDEAVWVAPSGPIEEMLAGIWGEVLRLDRVGARDNFFALGGHSLLATQVVSRLREALSVDLPVRQLFETPTVAELARAVARERQEATSQIVPRVARDTDPPLSFAQQRLWFLDQLEPGSPAYNIPLAVRLTGELRPDLLARVFAEAVRRHAALRTTFAEREGQPVQVIAPPALPALPALPVVDLSHVPPGERDERARRIALEEAGRPFDLQRGPLLRVGLVRLGERDHLLLVTMHHIVSDGWSLGVLLREITVLVEAFSQGKPSPLPELPVQYADFALWQRSWLQGQILEDQLAYWTRQLAGAPAVLELPTDHPRPPVQTYRGAAVPVTLPPALSAALREFSRSRGVTPFMALLAAWSVVLGRHAGQDDVLVGTPIAGRNRREVEGLIGLFVNTLVMRTAFAISWSFGEVVGRVRQTALDAYAHQDLPFERLVEELVPERDMSHSPLFQVLLVLQNVPRQEVRLPGLTLAPVEVESRVAKLDLTLTLMEGSEGFAGSLEHNTDLFDPGTAERFLARFMALLEAAAVDPGQSVADLPLLLPAERRQLLAWNETGAPPETSLCLHELFAAQAARTPGAVALVDRSGWHSYADLAARAGGLAHRLRGLGIGPEARVAVCLERSPDLIVALLGVLAAGGAYVPIDPAYPAERRALMLEDSGAAVLVTRGDLGGQGSHFSGATVEVEDRTDPSDPSDPSDLFDLPPLVLPGNLAYLIYTSGSTGRPKGVAIEHRSAVALALWARETFSAEELSGVLAATSVCFDLSVFEIFAPLAWGGTVILAENALELPTLPAASEVRLVNTVPSAAAELVRSGGLPPSVRTVNLAGEPLPGALVDRMYATGTVQRVLNLYGPSEDTTYSTGALVPPNGERSPAIGRPLPGTRAWVVDRQGVPVPPGVAGELWLAGAGLARGYLGRPELTAERFTPDPFGEAGGRVYRTGDLVRHRQDGQLEFLGRIDFQVKVRGFRIELGEIEETLRRHPAVRESVVVAREGVLTAYVVFDRTDRKATLAAWLQQRLPHYMVPSAFVLLESLPLTPNGKVDRKALPAPERVRAVDEESWAAPSDPVEELLAGIWAEVLGLDRVGARESFFGLGGHSLLATQVISRIRGVLGVELPLRGLFEAPTVAELARRVREARREGAAPPPLVPVPREGDLPLSFAQQRLWFLDQLQPGSPAYNIPLPVRLRGDLRPDLLARSFAEVVRRHEALRTSFPCVAGQPVQAVAKRAMVPLPLVDLEALPAPLREGELRRLVRADALRPFGLAAGPLLRTTLMRLEPREHAVLVTMHHIVSDGWSLGVFLAEVGALYPAFAQGLPSPLPELAVQYGDYAAWQRAWVSGDRLAAEIAWWKERLAGVPAALELPADRPRPARQTFRGAAWPVDLPPAARTALVSLGRAAGATPFMTLLALFQTLLGRWSGQEDFVVGTPIAGRLRAETEPLIGFFVNTLALRAVLADDPSFQALLVRVRETALEAYAHQELPFERLVEEVQPERDLRRPALVQVLLALQNTPVTAVRSADLAFEPLAEETGTAKLDLSLHLSEQGDRIAGALTYSTDLFDAATVARCAGHLLRLLEGAAADPGRRLSDLPLLTETELHQLVRDSGGGQPAPVSEERCIHELFAEQAARTPEAPSVVGEDGAWTYAELGRRVRRLARRLRTLGVAPDQPVLLRAERSAGLVAGLLGIMEAGGAYLAVEPDLPQERLGLLVQDAGVTVAVTRRPLAETLPAGVRPVFLEDLEADYVGAPDPAAFVAMPGHLAYVLYTSGSTGRPKGVMVEHRQLAAYVRGLAERLDLAAGSPAAGHGKSFATVSSFAADLGHTAIFAALLHGGCLHVMARERLTDAAALAEWMEIHPVDGLKIVPSHLAALLTAERPERLLPRRWLVLGGEALPWDLVERVRALAPQCRVFNHYGPTETTVGAVAGEVGEAGGRERGESAPLGRPLGRTRVWVLDRRQHLVPAGAPGEICIGGPQVTRGYLGRPDLTAERFIPDPFDGTAGARLYRTGDLARRRPDGALEFLGRTDHQVKVRGFRIELGEIEATLRAHPAVRECVVLARQDAPGERRLVAYVTLHPDAGSGLPASDLRAFLEERLPAHMMPTAVVVLEALPLTPNGKIDRRALPAPDRPEEGYVPPRDEVELRLVRIWEDLLDVRPVGVRDNFFALGGHSLLVVRLMGSIERQLGLRIPLSALMAAPTIERIAALVRQEAGTPRSLVVPLQPGGSGTPLFLVHPVGGNVFCYLPLVRLGSLGCPVYGIQSPALDAQTAPWTLETLAARYVEAIREIQPEGPYRLAGWSLGGVAAFEMARQLEAQGHEVALAMIDPGPPRRAQEEPDPRIELAQFVYDLRGLAGLAASGPLALPEGVETLEELLAREEVRALLPPDVSEEQLHELFTLFRANRRALGAYRPRPYGGRLTLIRAEATAEALGAEVDQAWSELAADGAEIRLLPGDHYSLLQPPRVETVAELLATGVGEALTA